MTSAEETGLARLKQALEANAWSIAAADGTEFEGGSDGDVDFGEDDGNTKELELGTKHLLKDTSAVGQLELSNLEQTEQDGDLEVEELHQMLLRMQAIKGMDPRFHEVVRPNTPHLPLLFAYIGTRHECRFARTSEKESRCTSCQRHRENIAEPLTYEDDALYHDFALEI